MTINELLALAGMTASDEIPVWDAEGQANGRTKKITAENLAASIKTIASLIASTELDASPTEGSTNAVQSGGVYDAIQQSTANMFDITTTSLSFDENGVSRVPLRSGYWLVSAGAKNGFGLPIGYSPSNTYYVANNAYASKSDVPVYLTWVKVSAP